MRTRLITAIYWLALAFLFPACFLFALALWGECEKLRIPVFVRALPFILPAVPLLSLANALWWGSWRRRLSGDVQVSEPEAVLRRIDRRLWQPLLAAYAILSIVSVAGIWITRVSFFAVALGPGRTVETQVTGPELAAAKTALRRLEGFSEAQSDLAKLIVFVERDQSLHGFSFLFETQDPVRHHHFYQLCLSRDEWRVDNVTSQANWIADMGNVLWASLPIPPSPSDSRWITGPVGYTSIPIVLGHSYWIRCVNTLPSRFEPHDFYVKIRVLTWDQARSVASVVWDYGPEGRGHPGY